MHLLGAGRPQACGTPQPGRALSSLQAPRGPALPTCSLATQWLSPLTSGLVGGSHSPPQGVGGWVGGLCALAPPPGGTHATQGSSPNQGWALREPGPKEGKGPDSGPGPRTSQPDSGLRPEVVGSSVRLLPARTAGGGQAPRSPVLLPGHFLKHCRHHLIEKMGAPDLTFRPGKAVSEGACRILSVG